MNFRSRPLLDLAYALDCTLRIPGVCEGGTGEPCHANEAIWGKGGAMKAHDFAYASGCRACHVEIDQGSGLSEGSRRFYWLRGHVETMRQLWERGLLRVATESRMTTAHGASGAEGHTKQVLKRRRVSRCTPASNQVKRNPERLA